MTKLGFGNIGKMMKQVQEMQSKAQEAQEKIADTMVEGKSAGGMVTATLNGKGEVKSIRIDPDLIKPEDKEVLEDLIVAAINDGKNKADKIAAEEMQSVTGGLPLPEGFKLPF